MEVSLFVLFCIYFLLFSLPWHSIHNSFHFMHLFWPKKHHGEMRPSILTNASVTETQGEEIKHHMTCKLTHGSKEVRFYLKCCMNCLNASTVSARGTIILMRIWDASISSSFTFISGAKGRKNTSLLKSGTLFSLNVRSYNVPLSLSVRKIPAIKEKLHLKL